MTRITRAEALRMGVPEELLPPPESKYRNVPTEAGGVWFDSEKEAGRYLELLAEQQAGEISGLRFQKKDVRFPLRVNGMLICVYESDFCYWRRDPATGVFSGELVVEDVKSEVTRLNPVYRLKKKMMRAIRGIEILET